jgi:site-specific DNA-methyltransferase (adenine-specific)/modification methylase
VTWREEIIGSCRLIQGDCREILPTLGKVDCVVTDPPYGIGEAAGKNASRGQLAKPRDYGFSSWDDEPCPPDVVATMLACSQWQIIFGGNFFHGLGPASCWLVWDKLNSGDFADCELAWTNLPKAVRRIQWRWNGMIRRGDDIREHPTQKPEGVMTWCIEHLPEPNHTILDPFAGSGTTLVACTKLGRRGIGIEVEPKYFDIACRRVEAATRQPDLFIEQPKPAKQLSLLGDAA